MTDYHNMTEGELEVVCKTRFCCNSMAENVFNGDITADIRIGIKLSKNVSWGIKFCPWCSKPTKDMLYEKELIQYFCDKAEEESEELPIEPCPCCRSPATLERNKVGFNYEYWVSCDTCLMRTEPWDDKNDIIATWNRRDGNKRN